MTIRCNVDTVPVVKKPSGDEAKTIPAAIVKRTKCRARIRELTPTELAAAVTCGYSFTAAEMAGTRARDWVSQQMVVVDIDNDNPDLPFMRPNEAEWILRNLGVHYSFIYYSFSHTPEHPKFRIVIVLDAQITDPDVAKRLNEYVISLFAQADKACKNLDRWYYGTNLGLCGEVNPDPVHIDIPEQIEMTIHHETPAYTPSTNTDSELGEAIRAFPLKSHVEVTTGQTGYSCGDGWFKFKTCPICHHSDDFCVHEATNMFKCHSAADGRSGNIINYIMCTMNTSSIGEARNIFRYDILGQPRPREQERAPDIWINDDNVPRAEFAAVPERKHKSTGRFVNFSDVADEPIEWIWSPYLARGDITLIGGDPGVGKTQLAMKISAHVTRGEAFPYGGSESILGNVVYQGEDRSSNIRKRLESVGADLNSVAYYERQKNEPRLSFRHNGILDIIDSRRPDVVIFDTLQHFSTAKNLNDITAVDEMLSGVADLAEEYNFAAIILMHLNKMEGANPLYRLNGSNGIIGKARSVLLTDIDADDPTIRNVFHVKNNHCDPGETIRYRLHNQLFEWAGITYLTAEQSYARTSAKRNAPARDRAIEFLESRLAGGAQKSKIIEAEATAIGITPSALQRAATALNVIKERNEDSTTTWTLPKI